MYPKDNADGNKKATVDNSEIYAIRDIVRAAHSMVILVGPSVDHKRVQTSPTPDCPEALDRWLDKWGNTYNPESMREWMQLWGSRLWTFPEILLISSKKPVKVLSLANVSEAFLERLICLQPRESGKPWHYQKDFWGSKLRDIEPRCQIAGIVDNETVILDGAYGATIQWNSMQQVYFFTRPTLRRILNKWILHGSPLCLAAGIVLVYLTAQSVADTNEDVRIRNEIDDERTKSSQSQFPSDPPSASPKQVGLLVLCIFILLATIGFSLATPAILLNIYIGKFWNTQASFVGMEGVPDDLGLVEEYLFASDSGRLKWSTAGSTLSRHKPSSKDEKDECVGERPLLDDQGHGGHDSESSNYDDLKTFTVIDTYSMTAMAFRAARPPTAVVVCGQEGGMQRAALCSYDWKRNTFSREQVVRLKTIVLDRMSRMGWFRFSLKRAECEAPASLEQATTPRVAPESTKDTYHGLSEEKR
ncbi:hypothetical protein PG994_011900 [Apiospora phragmitis]|uniref:Uncharacterized protein n=1 Tax=Apiospora phragmitis TaxID=2905665 RepID=A0ABR1TU28_9PEZI